MTIGIDYIEYQNLVTIYHHLDYQMEEYRIIGESRKIEKRFLKIWEMKYSTSNVVFIGEDVRQVHWDLDERVDCGTVLTVDCCFWLRSLIALLRSRTESSRESRYSLILCSFDFYTKYQNP